MEHREKRGGDCELFEQADHEPALQPVAEGFRTLDAPHAERGDRPDARPQGGRGAKRGRDGSRAGTEPGPCRIRRARRLRQQPDI